MCGYECENVSPVLRYPGSQIDIIAALYIIIIIIHSMVPSYSFVIILLLLLTVGYHLWPEGRFHGYLPTLVKISWGSSCSTDVHIINNIPLVSPSPLSCLCFGCVVDNAKKLLLLVYKPNIINVIPLVYIYI